jgi:hypothetical protein
MQGAPALTARAVSRGRRKPPLAGPSGEGHGPLCVFCVPLFLPLDSGGMLQEWRSSTPLGRRYPHHKLVLLQVQSP